MSLRGGFGPPQSTINHPHEPYIIECNQCQAVHPETKAQCKRSSCKTWPQCYQHLRLILGLQVKRSSIEGAGCGLFVATPNESWAKSNQIVKNTCMTDSNESNIIFKKGIHSLVAPQTGELLSELEEYLRQESRDTSGRYLLSRGNESLDSIRTSESVARFANHKPKNQTNADLALVPGSLKESVQDNFRNVPWIIATKNLRVGDEVFVNYGNQYKFVQGLMPDEIKPKRNLCK